MNPSQGTFLSEGGGPMMDSSTRLKSRHQKRKNQSYDENVQPSESPQTLDRNQGTNPQFGDRLLLGTAVDNTRRTAPALQTHRLGDVWRSLERPPEPPGNCKPSRDGYRRSGYRRSRSF